MKKAISIVCLMLAAALLCGCNAAVSGGNAQQSMDNAPVVEAQISLPTATDVPEAVANPDPTDSADGSADGGIDFDADAPEEQLADKGDAAATTTSVSLTTGLPVAEGTVYHPIAVMVPNTKSARPQINLMKADIIYMIPVESMITRMMCIFNDNMPEIVGPVRSLRLQFLNVQREWDCPIVHVGGPSGGGAKVAVFGSNAAHLKLRFNLGKAGTEGMYWRDGTGDTSMRVDLTKANEAYDYFPEYRNQFLFNASANLSAGSAWTEVCLPFMTSDQEACVFTYHAADNRLYMAYDGEKFMTKTVNGSNTEKEQYSCQNLIVQHTKISTLSTETYGTSYKDVTLTGSGTCDFFIGGMHLTGTWARETLDDATTYLLDDGTPLTLLPGNTFVAIHPTSGEITVN